MFASFCLIHQAFAFTAHRRRKLFDGFAHAGLPAQRSNKIADILAHGITNVFRTDK